MKQPVGYEDFMYRKQDNEEVDVTDVDRGPSPLPPLPPKPKPTFGLPFLIGAVVFLLIIAVIGIFYSVSGNYGNIEEEKAQPKSKIGDLKMLHVDSDYSIYNEKVDNWAPRNEGSVRFGTIILTGLDSRRNLFTVNHNHSIRADKDTKFRLDSSEATAGMKDKVKISLIEGSLWISPEGDVFEVVTPQGSVLGEGNDFEVSLKDNTLRINAWKGNVKFCPKTPTADKGEVEIKEGKMLMVDSKGNMIPKPPNLLAIESRKNPWQAWNLLVKNDDLKGTNPIIPHIAREDVASGEAKKSVEVKVGASEKSPSAPPEIAPSEKPIPPPVVVAKPSPVKNEAKLDLPSFEEKNKYPTKGEYGKKQEQISEKKPGMPPAPPPPVAERKPSVPPSPPPPPVANNPAPQAPNANPPINPTNPPPPVGHKVHQGDGGNFGGGLPGGYDMGSQETPKAGTMSVLENKNKQTNRTAPPGFNLGDKPVGPSEK